MVAANRCNEETSRSLHRWLLVSIVKRCMTAVASCIACLSNAKKRGASIGWMRLFVKVALVGRNRCPTPPGPRYGVMSIRTFSSPHAVLLPRLFESPV